MAHTIVVPRLGWTMEEGTFVEWLKRDGDSVKPGDKLFVLEGEKATEEIEAIDAGVLRIPPDAPKGGATVAVGAVLGYLCEPGEREPWRSDDSSTAAPAPVARSKPAPIVVQATPAQPEVQSNAAPSSPPPSPQPSSSQNVATVPVTAPQVAAAVPTISPRALKAAQSLGVDWQRLKGSGRTGRIVERDVVAASSSAAAGSNVGASIAGGASGPNASAASFAAATVGLTGRWVGLSNVRKTVAERMLASVLSTAAVTLTSRADATNLVALRRQFQAAAAGPDAFVPSYTELIARLAAGVLAQHPRLNACWQNDGLLEADSVNLGIAVDTDAGLVVPVVKGAERLSLRDLAGRVRAAIERARQRRLSTDDLSGGTFTITSLGMFGVDAFTPILNPPQIAILGVGRITREPAAIDEQVAIRDSLWLSLTFDHRAVDGAPAAKLLSDLRAAIENPGPRLVA